MVAIRLSRGGAKRRPFYRVVVTDSRSRRDGRFIEQVGFFNPIATGGERALLLDQDRIGYWLGCGAKPTESVAHLIKRAATESVGTQAEVDKGPEAATEASAQAT
jgi:small subunit ribosomal protein S16